MRVVRVMGVMGGMGVLGILRLGWCLLFGCFFGGRVLSAFRGIATLLAGFRVVGTEERVVGPAGFEVGDKVPERGSLVKVAD